MLADASPVIHSFISPVITAMGGFASLLCVFFIVWGGISYISSSGNPSRLQHAKSIIIRALIGLSIVLAASAISLFLMHTFTASNNSQVQHLPQLNTIKTIPASSGLVGILIKAITGVFGYVIETAAKPFISALSYFTKATPLLVQNASVMHLWLICTGIADGLVVLAIALIGFHVMGAEQLGIREVNLRSLIPQIIFIFILINTSIYILDGVIELSNAMIDAIKAGAGNLTPWRSLEAIVNSASSYSLAALMIFVIFIVFAVILLIYYIGRIVALYLGAVISPIILLVWLIPGFRDFAENALKTYLATIFVLFVHVIILTLAASLFNAVGQSGNSSPDPIMTLLLGLATLIALIKTQGVLMQLNYASIGPKTARRLGGSFINGITYLAVSAKYNFGDLAAPLAAVPAEKIANILPETKSQSISELQAAQAKGKKK